MKRHPAAQEDGGSHAGYNKQVQIFSQIEETEVHTAIFGVVSCRQFAFCFRQVERPTVTLCISGYQVDNESDHCRNVSFEVSKNEAEYSKVLLLLDSYLFPPPYNI